MHQGDLDKQKGVYHINAVDEETQFEVVASVAKISEHYLIPILEQMLETFPFKILGFHSDNDSEYINQNIAKLLKKLLIEFTKSRSRHSNDNTLAESKNASVVRKVLGYRHIPHEKLKSMINSEKYLKDGVTFEIIDKVAFAMTDNQSADRLQQARQSLFKTIDEREISAG